MPATKEERLKNNFHYQEVDVYHKIQNFIRNYIKYSSTIPKCILEVNQHIHGELFSLSRYIFRAANEDKENIKEKIDFLNQAVISISELYNGFKYLISSKAIPSKKWINLSSGLMNIYEDIIKWLNSLDKMLEEE